MFDEMRFLFSIDPSLRNKNNIGDNVTNQRNPVENVIFERDVNEEDNEVYLNTYIVNRDNVRNYIKSEVNRAYNVSESNPYIELIKFTNEPGTSKSLKLNSSDFAYLRDIGVMPINKLMILRRFSEGTIVPVDLNELNAEPISVIIGWVKNDSNLLSFTFNEVWEKQTEPLHTMLQSIIFNEFGFDLGNIVPIPGWGQGFMFDVLNEMGLTSYNKDRLPMGDPNLLKETITRPHESFGLQSSFSFELETVYEQKYISGVDPTVSTFDILNNLLTMGTSNTRFYGKRGGEWQEKLRRANESYNNGQAWLDFAFEFIELYVNAIVGGITKAGQDLVSLINLSKDRKSKDDATETSNDNDTNDDDNTATLTSRTNIIGSIFTANNSFINTILASTLGRYQWPLRGSISMFTGDATTPWHLTIGNPYAPLLSMNNIYVSNVEVKMGNDMGHNDLPKIMDVKVSMSQGRNLGKQEIYNLFGVRYRRDYYNKTNSEKL